MKNWTILLLVAMLSTAGLSLTACEEKGPAEKVGESLDRAGEDIKEGARDAGREIEDAVER